MVENGIQEKLFDLTSGLLCLDFTNTVDDRTDNHPQELLTSYSDLISWSQQAHVLTEEEANRLLEKAARYPLEASKVLKRAVVIREVIFRIFKAVGEDATPEDEELVALSDAVANAQNHAQIVSKVDRFEWEWKKGKASDLDSMLWQVVQSAADFLTSDELNNVRVCASDSCDWLFVDTSKNHSRRWCNMRSCGNREKARRFYTRKKSASTVS